MLMGVLLLPKLKEIAERFKALPHLVTAKSQEQCRLDLEKDCMKIRDGSILKLDDEEPLDLKAEVVPEIF